MEPLIIRDQHLEFFGSFSGHLRRALSCTDSPTGKELSAVLMGECVQCGVQVNGCEILQLSEPVEKAQDTTKLGRLRFAYCARKGCKSYFYKLKFYAHPQFDWSTILAHVDKVQKEPSPEDIAQEQLLEAGRNAARRQLALRVCAGTAGMVLIFIAFQWYNGGTIPFLREPEKFIVDPMPQMSQLGRYE